MLTLPTSLTIPPTDTVVKWSDVVEDTSPTGMYDINTGIITVPKAGLWQISVTVAVSQNGSPGIPSRFYQHLLIMNKSTDGDGYSFRLMDVYQRRWTSAIEVQHQLILRSSDITRLATGERLTIDMLTYNFDGGTAAVDTLIGGGFCLNCISLTRLGN